MIKRLIVAAAAALLVTQPCWAGDSRLASVLTEDVKSLFLLQLVVIFGTLAAVVPLCRRFKIDDFVGEIIVGILLSSGLAWIAPKLQGYLFPEVDLQRGLLLIFAELGVLFLMLQSGKEIAPEDALRHKKAAIWIGIGGLLLPIAAGYVLTLVFCRLIHFAPPGGQSIHVFALFMGNTMAISAMVIIVRLFKALDVGRTKFGQVVLCAYAVNDIVGWMIYGAIFQLASGKETGIGLSLLRLALAAGLTWACLRWVPRFINHWLTLISTRKKMMSIHVFVFSLALILGLVTHYLGVTLYFGVFLAGVVLAGTPQVTEEVKTRLTTLAEFVMTPVFFVLIGMQIEFGRNFSWSWVVFISLGSVVLKYVFAALCAIPAGCPRKEWHAIGVACIPGGVNGIIFGGLAMSYRLVDESIMGGIVVASIVSSVITGPLLKQAIAWIAEDEPPKQLADFVHKGLARLSRFDADTRAEAFDHVVLPKLASETRLKADEIGAILDRIEAQFHLEVHPGLPDRVSYSHCSIPELDAEKVFFFWSGRDVMWPNDIPVRIAVVHLVPEGVVSLELKAKIMKVLAKIRDEKLVELDGSPASYKAVHERLKALVAEVK